MERVFELLDRHAEAVRRAEGPEFVRALRRFYDFITKGPPEVSAALTALRREAAEIEAKFNAHDEQSIPELVGIRDEFAARVPAADDSGVPRPPRTDGPPLPPPHEWTFGLANFDQIAAEGPDRLIQRQGYDASRSGMLIRILEQKLRVAQWYRSDGMGNLTQAHENQHPELDDLARRLRNIGERHRHAAQAVSQAVEEHGGFQVQLLDIAVTEMNPEPREVVTEEDEHAWMNETFKRVMGGWHYWQQAAAGGQLDDQGKQALEHHIHTLRPATERVYEDLRVKLVTAPEPPTPYFRRLTAWISSPPYQLIGGPCVGGAIVALVTETEGLALFAVLAVLVALIPPAVGPAPALLTRAPGSTAFIVLTTLVVAGVMFVAGLVWALLAFVALVGAFALGQRAGA